MSKKQKLLVLSSGGTGGHIFPAISLSKKLIDEGYKVVFFTDVRGEKYFKDIKGVDVKIISSASPSGGLKKKLQAIIPILKGISQSLLELKKLNPSMVIGFGGYPSFPTIFASLIMSIKTLIHEQNSVLGKVNRSVLPFVKNIATSFQETTYLENKKYLNIAYTGNPVREEILLSRNPENIKVLENETIEILITGGSQSASFFSEIIPLAISRLSDKIKVKLKIYQQCSEQSLKEVEKSYSDMDVNAEIVPFFYNIAERLVKCDLFIGRAGASTISEIITIGKPSILIPLPNSVDNHQYKNAVYLGYKNASIVLEQKISDSEMLCKKIESLLENKEELQKVALNAYNLGKDNATEKLYYFITQI